MNHTLLLATLSIVAILCSGCPKNNTRAPASVKPEITFIGDCAFSTVTEPPKEEKGLALTFASTILAPAAVSIAMDSLSSYIIKKEVNKSAESTAISYRQLIDTRKDQCLFFLRGGFGAKDDAGQGWDEAEISGAWKKLINQGVSLYDQPDVYVEVLLKKYVNEPSKKQRDKLNEAKKNCESTYKKLTEARKETQRDKPKLRNLEDEMKDACDKFILEETNFKAQLFTTVFPKPTYVNYKHGGAKTNSSGEKDISLTTSFSINKDGKNVPFYSYVFNLGKLKPGDKPITEDSQQFYIFNSTVGHNDPNKPSIFLPSFRISGGTALYGVTVSTTFLETEEQSDLNMFIAKALTSDDTKDALLAMLQDGLEPDSEKELKEAASIAEIVALRGESKLGCRPEETLGQCVIRVKREILYP
ncbi:MAG: hypothetical protein KQH59_03590 [Desulfobulbaceae bacterium]|nr:hypothetical protein [Desulfobulbaceae bacterium]